MTGQCYVGPASMLTFIFCVYFVSAEIYQQSAVGQTAEMTFAAGLYGAQYECGVFKANGDLQSKISFCLIFRS